MKAKKITEKLNQKDITKGLNSKDKESKIKEFNYGKHISVFSIDKFKEFVKIKFKKPQYFMVFMCLRNGSYSFFSVAPNDHIFNYRGGNYFIDSDLCKKEHHTGLSILFYHQDSSIPFKIKFDIDKLFKRVEQDEKGISLALNPNSLKGFIKSQVIEKVLKGQELTDDMNFMKKLIIINLLVSGAMVVLMAKSMGYI